MSEIVKYNNDFNLLPMPELKAIQMDMFMAIISLTKDKKENTPFLK
ncbi:RepB family plasmid replication initiator protein, partial [Campylobacter jejuni]|nr:RepB family plasmid replication initiator protein [Campylobacter jejuni]